MVVFVVWSLSNQSFFKASVDWFIRRFSAHPQMGVRLTKTTQLETRIVSNHRPVTASQRQAYETSQPRLILMWRLLSRVGRSQIYVYDANTNTNYNPTAEEKAGIFAHQHPGRIFKNELVASLFRIKFKQTKAFLFGSFVFFFISKIHICHFVFWWQTLGEGLTKICYI